MNSKKKGLLSLDVDLLNGSILKSLVIFANIKYFSTII